MKILKREYKNMEKVSIIVPVYNVEEYLEKCICSIINQTYQNIEIIIINDGSTDNSRQICEKYARMDTRIKLINKKNGGLSSARNCGIKNASGNYILFVDSDDYIEKNTVETFLQKIEQKKLEVIIGNAYVDDAKGNEEKFIKKRDKNQNVVSGIDYLINKNKKSFFCVFVCINMYRRDFILQNNLFFKEGILHEDEDWTPRVFMKAKKVKGIDFVFYHYIKHRENSITNSKDKTRNMIDLLYIYTSLEKEINNSNLTKKQSAEILDYLCRRIYKCLFLKKCRYKSIL